MCSAQGSCGFLLCHSSLGGFSLLYQNPNTSCSHLHLTGLQWKPCVFTGSADAPWCLAKQWSCARVISAAFTLQRPKRPCGVESLPLSHWICPRGEIERFKELRIKKGRRFWVWVSLSFFWILQAAGQEMRRRTPTDLKPLAASLPISETI